MNTMTVKELKAILARYNDDDEVAIRVHNFEIATAVLYVDFNEIMMDEE